MFCLLQNTARHTLNAIACCIYWLVFDKQKARFKCHIAWPPIPWSVNSFLQNDIYSIVLRVKDALCHEHFRIIDWFLDPIIPIFYWQRHLLFRHEYWWTKWVCLHRKEGIQVTFSLTYHVTISCCHFWCETCSL